MMAINLKNSKKEWGWPILFGCIFFGGFIFLAQIIPGIGGGLSVVVNAIGVTIMYQLFWNKQIGKDTKYRAKPIWIPLIIAAFIFIFYFIIRHW